MQDHMEGRPWRPHGMFFISQERDGTYRRTKICMCFEVKVPHGACVLILDRRPDGSVGMALVLPALTDCRWWFESLLVHSGVSSATRRKATGADRKKNVSSFWTPGFHESNGYLGW